MKKWGALLLKRHFLFLIVPWSVPIPIRIRGVILNVEIGNRVICEREFIPWNLESLSHTICNTLFFSLAFQNSKSEAISCQTFLYLFFKAL